MNTFSNYHGTFIAKCDAPHTKGDTIIIVTSSGKQKQATIHKPIYRYGKNYYYSVILHDSKEHKYKLAIKKRMQEIKQLKQKLNNPDLESPQSLNYYLQKIKKLNNILQIALNMTPQQPQIIEAIQEKLQEYNQKHELAKKLWDTTDTPTTDPQTIINIDTVNIDTLNINHHQQPPKKTVNKNKRQSKGETTTNNNTNQ